MLPFHDLSCGEVGRRGLVVLGLLRERVAQREPRRRERPVQAGGFSNRHKYIISMYAQFICFKSLNVYRKNFLAGSMFPIKK